MTHYDVVVIGAGSGNMVVNRRFSDLSIAICEEGRYGGTCLNAGCIPTKMYVYPADLIREAGRAGELGVDMSVDRVRWADIRDRIFGRVDHHSDAAHDYRLALPNHTLYDEHVRFVGERTLKTASGEVITGDRFVIAAGSRPVIPDLPGLADAPYLTSENVMHLAHLPKRMVILGGGVIGAEFAHVFSAYGTEVVQVQRGGRLLRHFDEQVAARFTELAKRQWEVRLNTEAAKVAHDPVTGETTVCLDDGTELVCDALLIATGRRANSDLLDVVRTGVETDADGVIRVDRYQQTSVSGIYALGDIANDYQLKHVANHEARVIQYNLLNPDARREADHRFVPRAVFSSPQVASAGRTEQQLRADGIEPLIAVQDYADVAYGWAMEDDGHFAKLLADPESGRLVGAHLVGPQASVLIQPLISAMSFDLPFAEVARGQYWIHPALTEVVENALLGLEKARRRREN